MHHHVIAGDYGYLPTYNDEEVYTHKTDALEGLRDYVDMVVDSVEDNSWYPYSTVVNPPQFASKEQYWLSTGVVTDIGTDGCKDTIQAIFDRERASLDYAEIVDCYEVCANEYCTQTKKG